MKQYINDKFKEWKLIDGIIIGESCPKSGNTVNDCKPELEIPNTTIQFKVRCYNCNNTK